MGRAASAESPGRRGRNPAVPGWGQVEATRGLVAHSQLHQAVPITAALAGQGPGPAGVSVGAHGQGGAVGQRGGHVPGQGASPRVDTGFHAGGR